MEKISATPPQGTPTPNPTESGSERPKEGALYDCTKLAAEVAPGEAVNLIGPIGRITRRVVGTPAESEPQIERKGIALRLRTLGATALQVLQRELAQKAGS